MMGATTLATGRLELAQTLSTRWKLQIPSWTRLSRSIISLRPGLHDAQSIPCQVERTTSSYSMALHSR